MFIDYNVGDLDKFLPKFKDLLQHNEKKIEQLLELEDKSYSNFIRPLQEIDEKLDRFFTPLGNENGVNATKQIQDLYSAVLPHISQYYSRLTQNEELFKALEQVYAQKDLNSEQKHLLQLEIKDFILSGAKLSHDDKKTIEQIDLQLSEYSNEFGKNLLEATDAFWMEVSVQDLGQMPQEDIDAMTDEKGAYIVNLQMPNFIAFMTYSPNRALREKLYKAYNTRAPQNEKIIDEILQLRAQKAQLLGFENYSEYSIESKTAHSAYEVNEFLQKLGYKAKEKAQQEVAQLQEFAGLKLQSYDFAYYSQLYKKEKFAFDEDLTKPYFEQSRVVAGLFDLLSELFDLKFTKIDTPTWHHKVSVYEIDDGQNTSRLYLDLESRKNKRGGAWMSDFQTRFRDSNNRLHPASAFIVCNFASSDKGASLLRHDDVVTLFHEMGHALHHILSDVDERGVSGIHGVAWDVVEFPSQFLENFAYEPWVLKRFAKHYKTDAVIEDAYLEKIKSMKNFQAAIGLMRQLEFSVFDFMLHQGVYSGLEVQQLLDKVRDDYAVITPPSYNKFQHGFAHIFAGGYSAGYYSYKWAEVMSADAFFACVHDSGIDKEKAAGYKEHILQRGGSENMSALYKQWLHKDFEVESLLKLYDLA
ncbi:MAG: M3 family metallopeptidase [Campylobacterota bacterium]